MRLNFAGVPDEDIREGVRRIGRAMGGQAGLFGVLTGSSPAPASSEEDLKATTAGESASDLADVVELPRRGKQGSADRRSAGKRRDR